MEFHRGRNGLLGFGINEVGVVQKVDGLAKSIGLQTNSRLLQVRVQQHMSWADYMYGVKNVYWFLSLLVHVSIHSFPLSLSLLSLSLSSLSPSLFFSLSFPPLHPFLLQVEDRLLCCYTHSQIMELLTARSKQLVKAYVVPPPPNKCRYGQTTRASCFVCVCVCVVCST